MKPILLASVFTLFSLPALSMAQGYDTQGYDGQGYDGQGYDGQGYDGQGYDGQGYDAPRDAPVPAHSADIHFFDSAVSLSFQVEAPDQDFVWVDEQILYDGTLVEGFYRPRSRPGHTWSDGGYQDGQWAAGKWQSRRRNRNQVWVAGHRGDDGYWVAGYWRSRTRPGYQWKTGHAQGQVGNTGYWSPTRHQTQSEWVAGYWDEQQGWSAGFWRDKVRAGFTWKLGQWQYGQWQRGHWAPTTTRHGSDWSPGYHDGRSWVAGQWRLRERSGYSWVRARRGSKGAWKHAHWERSRRRATRRHQRVLDARAQAQVRVGARRDWRRSRVQERGVVQDHHNSVQRQERRVHRRVRRAHEKVERAHERVRREQERVRRKIQKDMRRNRRRARHHDHRS